jgi:secondary thiamine-phosphate synthase enzyme
MVYREEIHLESNQGISTFHDITDAARNVVRHSGLQNGIVVVYSHHTTCSVITQEQAFDLSMTGLETLQQDFIEILESIIPTYRKEGMYLHPGEKAIRFAAEHDEDLRGCHNTDAHLRSALVGRSESITLIDGKMDLGEFAHIYFIDFDQTRARKRVVQISVIGE